MKVQKIYNNKYFKNLLEFAADNGALFVSGTAFVLSTAVRPAAIMATPKTDKRNKEYACVKSFASSLSSLLIMMAASLPLANAIKKIDKTPAQYLNKSTINFLREPSKKLANSNSYIAATQLFKLGLGVMAAFPKSFVTNALIPPLMTKVFPEKNTDFFRNKYYSDASKVSFTGAYNKNINKISKGIGGVINHKGFQKFVNRIKDTNYELHIMNLTDVVLTGTFVGQLLKNKKIEENRKKPLIYNSILSTVFCIACGYGVNRLSEKPFNKFVENFKKANINSSKLEKYIEGLKIVKPALILGGVYYVLIPIISTFLADRAGKKPFS